VAGDAAQVAFASGPIAGLSGLSIYPSSVFPSDLLIGFSQQLSDFSILYAPQELATDSSATMRVTAYLGETLVGTATATATQPGTWPSATLAFSSQHPFDRLVVHYDKPPPTGGDWGPIFMADNMLVTPVPEPSTIAALTLIGATAVTRRRRHSSHA
jgi:hypothetical protein